MAGVFKYQTNGPEASEADFRCGASTLQGTSTVNERNEFNEERGVSYFVTFVNFVCRRGSETVR
jgi:hypothetical protein